MRVILFVRACDGQGITRLNIRQGKSWKSFDHLLRVERLVFRSGWLLSARTLRQFLRACPGRRRWGNISRVAAQNRLGDDEGDLRRNAMHSRIFTEGDQNRLSTVKCQGLDLIIERIDFCDHTAESLKRPGNNLLGFKALAIHVSSPNARS